MAMVIADLKKTTEQKMDKTIQAFKADLGKVRTGRAHTGLLDHIHVDYYGTPTPLNQVAKVTLLDGRTIGVTPFDKKMIQAVDKAIRESDLGLNPASQGDTVRVPMPLLTEERRKELTTVENCADRGIAYLTLFAFSSENWRRPAEEVALLMQLFQVALSSEVERMHRNGVRLKVVGDIGRFDPKIRALVEQGERLTADNR